MQQKFNNILSQITVSAINAAMQCCFNGNALADNIVYNFDVVFNLVQVTDIVHHKFAHWLPLFADELSDILTMQNSKPSRLPVSGHERIYENYVDCFQDLVDLMLNELEPAIVNAIEVADNAGDIKARILLEEAYAKLTNYTKQVIVWHHKAVEYEMNTGGGQSFDKDFPIFSTFI